MTTNFNLIKNIDEKNGKVFADSDIQHSFFVNNITSHLLNIPTTVDKYIAFISYQPSDLSDLTSNNVLITKTIGDPLVISNNMNIPFVYLSAGDQLSFVGTATSTDDIKVAISLYAKVDDQLTAIKIEEDISINESYNYILNGQFSVFNTNIIPDYEYLIKPGDPTFIVNGPSKLEEVTGSVFTRIRYLTDGTDGVEYFTLKEAWKNTSFSKLEATPKYFVNHRVDVKSTDATYKRYEFTASSANAFAGKWIAVCFQGKSNDNLTVKYSYTQNFGIGGSATNTVYASKDFKVTSKTQKQYVILSVDDTIDKIYGKDNYFSLNVELPVDIEFEFDFTNVQLNLSKQLLQYQYMSLSKISSINKALQLPTFPTLAEQPNIFENNYDAIKIKKDFTRDSLSYLVAESAMPVGITTEYVNNFDIDAFLILNDKTISQTKFKRLYSHFSEGNLVTPWFGYGNSARSILSIDTVTITNEKVGSCFPTVDGTPPYNTGFIINPIQAGTPSVPQILDITCGPASSFENNAHLFFYTPDDETWPVVIIKKGLMDLQGGILHFDPNLVLIYIDGDETAEEMAQKFKDAFNPLGFILVDPRGYSLRGTDLDSGRDPEAALRSPRGDGKDGTYDVPGTIQSDTIEEHTHPVTWNADIDIGYYLKDNAGGSKDSVVAGGFANYTPMNFSMGIIDFGGDESRGKNMYANLLIKT